MSFALDCADRLHQLTAHDLAAAETKHDPAAIKLATAERDAALARLNEAVKYTEATYPGSAEADKARMSLARINAIDGKYQAALEVYESIDKSSEKYPEALDMAGRCRFSRYLREKRKKPKDRNTKQMEEDRLKAIDHFNESVAVTRHAHQSGQAIPASLLRTELVLARIHLDANEYAQARDAIEPIVAAIIARRLRRNWTTRCSKSSTSP